MRDVVLRKMSVTDIDAVYAIELDVYRIDPWSREQIEAEFLAIPRTRHYVIAESAGEVIGYGGLFSPSEGVEADVQTLTVVTARQGEGIGRALLNALLDEARRRAAPAVLLEVRAGNEPAIALYRGFGFEEIARRPNYYGHNLDALVMRKPMSQIGEA